MPTRYPRPEITGTQYFEDGRFTPLKPEVTELEEHAMSLALDLGMQALSKGNPPVGGVLIDHVSGDMWGRETIDKSERHLVKHAEMRIYDLAQPVVGDDLSNCTLVTTAALCTSCAPHYAEGKIGKIVFAAPREYVFALTGIMRTRRVNMHDLLWDGATNTTVIGNVRVDESLGLFATYGRLRQHVPPADLGKYLRNIWRGGAKNTSTTDSMELATLA